MKRRRMAPDRSRGFALIAAIFLLVVIALLGAFAVRLNVSQQGSSDLDLVGIRADAAVQAGIQYAAARLNAAPNGCASLTNPLPLQNFNVAFQCGGPLFVANQPAVNVFSVTATATRGLYGSPDFVSRQRTVRITP